jgi:foldase protein PrsA
MAKDKTKKQNKNETPQQESENVMEAVVVEEEVIVVSENDDNQEETVNDTTSDDGSNGFGLPNLPTPNKAVVLIILVLAGLLGLMYFARQAIIAATINGKPLYRYQVIKRLEKDFGKQAYDNMVREELLKQEAQKRNVTVSQADIDSEFKKIDENLKSQGTSLDAALKEQNLTREAVTDSIRLQVLASKLVADKTKVTAEEIKQYTEQNKDMLPQDQTPDQIKKTVESYLKQQKEAQAVDTLLNDLKGKAKINQIFVY